MKTITKDEFSRAYELHQLWLEDSDKGEQLVFSDCFFDFIDFSEFKKLRMAIFARSNLQHVYLGYSDLTQANFTGSDLRMANMLGSDLLSCNFNDADLRGTDLRRTDIRRCSIVDTVGNTSQIISTHIESWNISATRYALAVGCEQHEWKEWQSFTDEEINDMDNNALEFWKKWKNFIFEMKRLKWGVDEKN